MKIYWHASLTWRVFHLWPASLIRRLCLLLLLLTPVSDDESENENRLLPAHVPPITLAPILPRWVRSTCEAVGDLAGDPEINVKHVLSFSEPLLFWLKFLRITIEKIL